MKKIKSTVAYTVPHWQFCNVDRFDMDATPSKQVCQFCIKTKGGYRCALYDQPLLSDGAQIRKLDACCKATAGFKSFIEPAEVPTIPPQTIIKQTIELYSKTVNDLLTQGYPRAMAEAAAKQYILNDK